MAKKKAAKKPRRTTKSKPAKRSIKKEPKPEETIQDRHYKEIVTLNLEVRESFHEWQESKMDTKHSKDIFETKNAALIRLISDGPNPQLTFDFDGDEPSPDQDWPDWMKRPVGVLGLTQGIVSKLEENELATLGHLSLFWKSGKVLTDLKGFGAENNAVVADTWAKYGKKHPEVYEE